MTGQFEFVKKISGMKSKNFFQNSQNSENYKKLLQQMKKRSNSP